MIFDVKMEDLRHEARLVVQGHVIDTPSTIRYERLVSKETVRIALKLADLNGADIQNAYITAPVTENLWTVLGPEFGEYSGRKAIVVRALYGLESAGAAFRNHLADYMNQLGFLPCTSDLDLLMKTMVRSDDGFNYYAYFLIDVDDVMFIHHDAKSVLSRIDKYFKLKTISIGDPEIYLGAKLKKTRPENGV